MKVARNLTNGAMAKAAQKLLDEHRATRPATPEEAAALALEHRKTERSLQALAKRLRDRAGHLDVTGGVTFTTDLTKEALRIDELARRAGRLAETWEREDAVQAWRDTEAVLIARLAYYQKAGRR